MSLPTDADLNAIGVLQRRRIEARVLAPRIDTIDATDGRFAFNVTRCGYAEMYRELGVPELGAIFSCNRDAALIDGFNPHVALERTQTLMGGASHCDFRYTLRRAPITPASD